MATKGAATRQVILDRALDVASTQGFEGLSIGTLADAVGMSKSGLFAHFRSKEQLQVDALRHASERFVAKVVAPALKAPRGEARVRAFFDGWLRWGREEFPGGCVIQNAVAELDDRPGPARETLVEMQRDLHDTIATIFRAGVAAGAFRPDLDARQLAFELECIVYGFMRTTRLLRDADAETLARRAFDGLLDRARVSTRKT
jgi:AcrR family transcriptional regulator